MEKASGRELRGAKFLKGFEELLEEGAGLFPALLAGKDLSELKQEDGLPRWIGFQHHLEGLAQGLLALGEPALRQVELGLQAGEGEVLARLAGRDLQGAVELRFQSFQAIQAPGQGKQDPEELGLGGLVASSPAVPFELALQPFQDPGGRRVARALLGQLEDRRHGLCTARKQAVSLPERPWLLARSHQALA